MTATCTLLNQGYQYQNFLKHFLNSAEKVYSCQRQEVWQLCIDMKVSKGAMIRSRYNQVPHPTQDTMGKLQTHS